MNSKAAQEFGMSLLWLSAAVAFVSISSEWIMQLAVFAFGANFGTCITQGITKSFEKSESSS